MENSLMQYLQELKKNGLDEQATVFDRTNEFPLELMKDLSRQGFIRCGFPKEIGGDGTSFKDHLEVIQELSTSFPTLSSIFLTQSSFAVWPIYHFGTEEQKAAYLQPLLEGKIWGAFALNEVGSGSQLSEVRTTAVEYSNHWLLNGAKATITNAPIAGLFMVASKVKKMDGQEGYGIFILNKKIPGLKIGPETTEVGLHALPVADLEFREVKIPKENILSGDLVNEEQVGMIFNRIRLAIAAQSIGIAKGAFGYGLKYVTKERKFGLRLINLIECQKVLSDVVTDIEAAESFLKNTDMLDYTATVQIAKVKLFCTKTSIKATEALVAMTGGYGYTRNNVIERFSRDAQVTGLYGGSTDAQKRIISKIWLQSNDTKIEKNDEMGEE
ncbi:acyl-CoA dehydrogenase family protein [Enterococcus sp. LJL120]